MFALLHFRASADLTDGYYIVDSEDVIGALVEGQEVTRKGYISSRKYTFLAVGTRSEMEKKKKRFEDGELRIPVPNMGFGVHRTRRQSLRDRTESLVSTPSRQSSRPASPSSRHVSPSPAPSVAAPISGAQPVLAPPGDPVLLYLRRIEAKIDQLGDRMTRLENVVAGTKDTIKGVSTLSNQAANASAIAQQKLPGMEAQLKGIAEAWQSLNDAILDISRRVPDAPVELTWKYARRQDVLALRPNTTTCVFASDLELLVFGQDELLLHTSERDFRKMDWLIEVVIRLRAYSLYAAANTKELSRTASDICARLTRSGCLVVIEIRKTADTPT